MGWSSKRNGELLRLMIGERFEVLLTVDRNLEFQQNLRTAGVGVVVVLSRTNRVKELKPLVPAMLDAISSVMPGSLVKVGDEPPAAKD